MQGLFLSLVELAGVFTWTDMTKRVSRGLDRVAVGRDESIVG